MADSATITITYEDATVSPPVDTRSACERDPTLPECQGGYTPTSPAGATGPSGPSGPTGPTEPSAPIQPTIDAINAEVISGSSIRVTATGSNYAYGATGSISGGSDSRTATNNNVISPTQFKCDIDMSNLPTGEYTFTILNPDGASATAKIRWTAAPSSVPTAPTPTTPSPSTPTPPTDGYYTTPSPSSPPPEWKPSEGCAVAAEDVELTDGFIIPKGSTICNDGSVLLTDGTWLPAGTATASHIKSGSPPAGGGVNLLAVGAVIIGLGALGYYMYSKRGEQ